MSGRFSVEAVFKAVDKITAPISRMQNRVTKMTRSMNSGLKTVNRTIDKTISGIKSASFTALKFGAVGIGAVTAAVGFMVKEFSKVENAVAAFTPLLKGAKKAKELVDALNKTAATTPFQFETLSSAAKQLLPVMRGGISQVIKTIRMLGDTAGGNAQKLDSITRGFTKAMLKGKVDMESLNMIAEAGVPIFGDLAAVMGTKVNAGFFKMISAGKVTTSALTKAFERMTQKGGIFFRGMEIASETLSGKWSTLKDNVSLTAAAFGSVFESPLKKLMNRVIEVAGRIRDWAEANKEMLKLKFAEMMEKIVSKIRVFIDYIKELHKEKSFLERFKEVFQKIESVISFLVKHKTGILALVSSLVALSVILKVVAGILTVINIISAANPYVLIALGVIALISAIVSLIKYWEKLNKWVKIAVISFGVLMGPIGWLILAAGTLIKNWDPVMRFFKKLWSMIKKVASFTGDKLSGMLKFIPKIGLQNPEFDPMKNESKNKNPKPQVVSPQERTARSIEEKRTTSTSEVTIKDETGRAQVTKGNFGPGLFLQPSGAF